MNRYTVNLSARAADWLEACRDEKLKRRVGRAIDALEICPRPPRSIKLTGEETVWRVRVGDYRILYEIFDQKLNILVIRIADRRDAYR
ncbi:MAG: type II toxin-antitoxin system RelE/ParE family toxin [Verrucomicrobia bacterium]|nr:type II toxin-antitoxin system RelE/ParE family toxin [Verrucomicrobiota bacterium]